jgi:class 3 adenylate cyclase/tetratricopeptide (TPR) repeat protein
MSEITRNLVANAVAGSGVLAPDGPLAGLGLNGPQGPLGQILGSGFPFAGQSTPPGLNAPAPASPAPAAEPAALTGTIHEAERRIVSILFADLVGFTARSDGSDPEQVRDFLTRYFEVARDVVGRYGGTIEKFIGDAVMAVWGTPVVREDDAERAVRAGLDLVEAVRRLGRAAGDDALECRAAVLTGEAAVSTSATDQALVAGDLVNTASRLQAAAPPGAVLVGEATERAANRAILFEPAGEQTLKGKQAPIAAWRALRVVAERGGRNRTETLEAPFVGRDEELRYLKDAYHATARERRSRLVSITGQAGIGKSRLAWEFSKYMDGLLEEILWHQGRSPAYGEGITFWALGEMIRRRAQLQETDDEATTRTRIAQTLAEYVPDEVERRWIEPTLLYLLGIGGAPSGGREDLFAAWRTFFERLASQEPAVLVFEDLQWADNGLLDFIDHLLDWSKSYPILVVTLARPELLDRRPGWGAGRRNYIALSLEPLPEPAMRELLAGLVPGLPEQATQAILERAGGIPLYAVETVRMLVAEGRLELVDATYQPVGDLSHLKVPESLQALVAARLDALNPADRSLLQDASILGQTFSTTALAAVAGESPEAIEPRLRDLARREVLALDTDPRSPERGQYGFNQALIREVAYSTLTKRDRRSRHLAAARHFEAIGDDELAGALASHYLAAYEASPPGAEAEAVGVQARLALKAAAERAAGLGSHDQAVAYLTQAIGVTTDPAERADLLERAAVSSSVGGRHGEAETLFRGAIEAHEARGDRSATARAIAGLADSYLGSYRAHAAVTLVEPQSERFADMPDDPGVIAMNGQLARAYFFLEDYRRSQQVAEGVLEAAERLELLPIIADTLVTRGMGHSQLGRMYEGIGALEAGLRLAESRGFNATIMRARTNLGGTLWFRDPRASLAATVPGLELARRLGRRTDEIILCTNAGYASLRTGDWGFRDYLEELLTSDLDPADRRVVLQPLLHFRAFTGTHVPASIDDLAVYLEGDADAQNIADYRRGIAAVALAAGDLDTAFRESMTAADVSEVNGPAPFAFAGRAATWAGDRARLEEALARHRASAPHGPALELERRTMEAAITAIDGRLVEATAAYRSVLEDWRDLGCQFDFALTAIDAAQLVGDDPAVAALIADGRRILVALGARPFVERLDAALATRAGQPVGRAGSSAAVASSPRT